MHDDDITISLFENNIPDAVEHDLEHLYQHLYSTLAHHRSYGGLAPGTKAYVARRNDAPVAVLLLRNEKNTVRVLNEQIQLDPEELNRFARYVFAHFSSVNVILFHAVHTEAQRIRFPCQHFHCTEDIVLDLPTSVDAYRARMGKATRSYLSRYMNKLQRDFPSMRHEVYRQDEIGRHHLQQIIDMNRARMADRNRESYIDDAEAERIIGMAQRCGLVSVITIDGRVCAGAINFRIGEHYFLKVIAHDSAYNDYRLGTLCCYLAICECIAQGGKEYHFLWGRYDYKYRLLGVQRDLDHVAVYRSRMHMLLNGRMVLRNLLDQHWSVMRSRLQSRLVQNERVRAALRKAMQTVRNFRAA